MLGLTQQMYDTLQRTVQGGQPQPQPQAYQPPPAQPQQGFPQIADDDYVNGATFRQAAPQVVRQVMGQEMAALQANIAQSNLEMVRADPKFASVFQKYGPEVYNALASVDKSYWNVDNIRKVVNFVKADHVDELAREEAQRLAAVQVETFRSSGAGLPPVPAAPPALTLQSDQLPAGFRKRLADVGMTETELDEFCRANDMSRADWFRMVADTVVTEASRG